MAEREPLVYLVGAGPGHPELLTVRAVRCLARADVVLYDRLIPTRILDLAPASAERIAVAELADAHAERCPQVQRLLVDLARARKRVVRLKGGDPLIFGRGGEEAQELRQAGIPYEIVPGVTAAAGAAAYADIPLTHRACASAVALVAGHEDPVKGESVLDWAALARFPGTLAVYMGLRRLHEIVDALVNHGKDPATPAAAVQMATTGEQRTVRASLAELPTRVREAHLTSPTVILVGPAVSHGATPSWAEQRPLFGKQVLVTRPRAQSGEMIARLEELGAVPITVPLIEIREPADWEPVDQALIRLRDFDWLIFTSANGVHAFVHRLKVHARDLRALGHLKLAAIGPAIGAALRAYHLEPDVIPTEFRSEALARALGDRVAGQRVLLARAAQGREILREELGRVASVLEVAVYAQRICAEAGQQLREQLRQNVVDAVTLTSSNIARAFAELLDAQCRERIEQGAVRLVTISPVTSSAVRQAGLPVAAEATEYTAEGVVQALLRLLT